MLKRAVLVLFAAALVTTVAAAAERVTADYLVGTWSLDGKPACGRPDMEHIVFDRDGGFRNYRGGRLQAAGLWHLGNDYIEFHVVSSAALINPDLDDYVGYFGMVSIDALETKVEKHRLELAVRTGDEMDHWELDRCKQ